MWQWIDQNSGALNVLFNAGILAVWAFYLQHFVANFRRARSSKILISCGAGEGAQAHCFVCNMSSEPVYVVDVIATMDAGNERWAGSITDNDREEREQPLDVTAKTKQGALKVGDMRDFGDFGALLRRVRRARGLSRQEAWPEGEGEITLELTVVAVYGPEDLPVAARRSFLLGCEEGRQRVRPATVDTIQVRSRAERRRVHGTMANYL